MTEQAAIGAALAQSSVLSALADAARAHLVNAGSPVELAAGALLFQSGDEGDAAFVVLSGELEVRTQSADGREVRIGALASGAVVGEMAVMDGLPRSADVVAARRSRLWRIPRAALVEALRADPAAALALVAALSSRLRAANAALEADRLLDLGGRLAQLLTIERSARGSVTMTQTEMARRLGFSREKVNRKLHEWARAGWVEISASGVRLLDIPALTRMLVVQNVGPLTHRPS